MLDWMVGLWVNDLCAVEAFFGVYSFYISTGHYARCVYLMMQKLRPSVYIINTTSGVVTRKYLVD